MTEDARHSAKLPRRVDDHRFVRRFTEERKREKLASAHYTIKTLITHAESAYVTDLPLAKRILTAIDGCADRVCQPVEFCREGGVVCEFPVQWVVQEQVVRICALGNTVDYELS